MTGERCGLDGGGALFTDLYELTMLQSYLLQGFDRIAVFELYFRTLPANRNFLLAAGLDRVLTLLEQLQFTSEELSFLAADQRFTPAFIESLRSFRFTGDVYALPEGTPVFPYEPLVQVIAPLPQAQLIETLLLNQLSFATLAATKAARCVLAARGRQVVDFGSRRAHGIDAALTVARATYLAGGAGTSLMEAARKYGIPPFGTMAHSYIQAHEDERRAFRDFTALYPGTTLLVDTYDTLAGVQHVIELSRQFGDAFQVGAIRLDSGDLADLAQRSRALLDEAGLNSVRIFASGGLDEFAIERFVTQNVPIDGFGIGTSLAVSEDAPGLDTAYKLVQYAGAPRTKLSAHKVIYPCRKQLFRCAKNGTMTHDLLARYGEDRAGEPLLQLVMQGGRRTDAGRASLDHLRHTAARNLAQLPPALRELQSTPVAYPVTVDRSLEEELETLRRRYESQPRPDV